MCDERSIWVYGVLGRVTAMSHASGTRSEHDYDAAGRLMVVRNLKSDRSVIFVFAYSWRR